MAASVSMNFDLPDLHFSDLDLHNLDLSDLETIEDPDLPWESVYGPRQWPENAIRGSFHLAVPFNDLENVWNLVADATVMGRLGYMSSFSPGAMTYGQLQGNWTISIHTVHTEMMEIFQKLHHFSIFDYAFKYDLNKRFRERFQYMPQYYNGFRPGY